jgi:lysyl-tRNA synthetase class II
MSPTENLPDPRRSRTKTTSSPNVAPSSPNGGRAARPSRTTSRAKTPPARSTISTTASREELAASPVAVKVAGRIMLKRVMGKASFITVQDLSGRIQVLCQPRPGRR